MHRLLNILGLIAFLLGAALVGYVLYLVLAGLLGFNPWGNGRPQVVVNTTIGMGLLALLQPRLGAAGVAGSGGRGGAAGALTPQRAAPRVRATIRARSSTPTSRGEPPEASVSSAGEGRPSRLA